MHIRSSFRHYWQVRPRLLFSVGAGLLCALLLPLQFSLLPTADDRLERAGLALLAVSLAIDAGKHADTYPSDRPYAG